MSGSPTLPSLIAAAQDYQVDDDTMDRLVAAWLGATGRMPLAGATHAILPGWRRPTAAERLMRHVLPGWEIDPRIVSTTGTTITGPDGAGRRLTFSGHGPGFGRALLAATFTALREMEPQAPDPMAALRGAMREELAHG